jgi:hypothetical protein
LAEGLAVSESSKQQGIASARAEVDRLAAAEREPEFAAV